jgi:hypothetical protein
MSTEVSIDYYALESNDAERTIRPIRIFYSERSLLSYFHEITITSSILYFQTRWCFLGFGMIHDYSLNLYFSLIIPPPQ